MRPKQTEKAFQAAVRQYAELRGWRVMATTRSKFSPAGEPDLRMVRGARFVWAELKSDTGRLSQAQQECLADLRKFAGRMNHALPPCSSDIGVGVYVWRPDDWPSIEAVLR